MLASTNVRATRPADRPSTKRPRWSARSARGISDAGNPRCPRRFGPPRRLETEKSLLALPDLRSVDDGKSTLIGRLLYDSKTDSRTSSRPSQQDSSRFGTLGERGSIFALLVDGLEAEREQGITIDVAYRYLRDAAARASSSPTRRATSNTPATWRPARPMPISP